jgi:hypothetical protein
MMGWNATYDPVLPWWAIAAIAAAGLVLIAAMALSRSRGVPLRALALALIVGALANPVFHNEERTGLTDIAVAVIDRSLSQEAGERTAQTDTALAHLRTAIGKLAGTELRTVEVRSGITADDDGTRAFAALNRALADIPPERYAGAIMLTDGQIHDVPGDVAGSGLGGPLHAIITGARAERDRRVVITGAPRFGIVGKEQIVKFRVEDANGDGSAVDITIKHGRGLSESVTVPPGTEFEFPVTIDHGGQNITEIEAAAAEGEISLQNNRAIAMTEGIRDRLRVLLISGQPHAGERTWRNLLKADASVDLVHFTILRPPEKQDGTPIKELALIAFPTRELFVEKLDEFDLVIFDRYRKQAVLPMAYLANVVDYVNNGGAVLIASGPDFAAEDGLYTTPLADILNAAPSGQILDSGYRPAITLKGMRHPVTRNLPGGGEAPSWGRWLRIVEAAIASGEVVMSGPDDKPLLVLSRTGEGRVAQLLSDQSWLWARGYEGGGPATELLRRMAHWLMKEPDLEEEALGGAQNGKQMVIERHTMADKAEPVTVTLPSGKNETVQLTEQSPGLFQGRLEITEPGLWRLTDGTLEAVAAAGNADAREASDIVATDAKLRPATAALGGAIAWAEDGLPSVAKVAAGRTMAGSGWLGLKANNAYRVTSVSEIPLFATLLSLGVLLLLVSGMWYREGR